VIRNCAKSCRESGSCSRRKRRGIEIGLSGKPRGGQRWLLKGRGGLTGKGVVRKISSGDLNEGKSQSRQRGALLRHNREKKENSAGESRRKGEHCLSRWDVWIKCFSSARSQGEGAFSSGKKKKENEKFIGKKITFNCESSTSR